MPRRVNLFSGFALFLFAHLLVFPVSAAGRFDTRTVGAFVDDCLGKMARVTSRRLHALNVLLYGAEVADQRRTTRLANYPRRRFGEGDRASLFLETHPVFISVTTSPKRITHLAKVIKSLDLTHVTEVIVALPEKYGRDGNPYTVPEELRALPKVRILTIGSDLGPLTKFLPAAEWLAKRGDSPLLITIDDDMFYPAGMVNELISAAAEFPNAAVGGVGAPLGLWGLNGLRSDSGPNFFWTEDISFRSVDVLEGFSAAAYPVKRMPLETLRTWLELGEDCRYSDDLLISMALRRARIHRYEISSRFYHRNYVYHLPHSTDADALHKGGGLTAPVGGGIFTPSNGEKYRRAFQKLREEGGLE